MTVQVDSQPVTDQQMWYIDMCCVNNSISCLETRRHLEHMNRHTMTTSMLVCLTLINIYIFVSLNQSLHKVFMIENCNLFTLEFTQPELILVDLSRACFLNN